MTTIQQQLRTELSDFDKYYSLYDLEDKDNSLKYNANSNKSAYLYKQKSIINVIDHYFLSQFTTSKLDDEGQRLIFVNQVQFPVRVARKQVDVDVKDAIFVPDTYNDAKKIQFARRQFQDWVKEHKLGKFINELLDDYTKYGTCVYRRLDDTVVRQDLHTLINKQNAKTLKDTATKGGYVIVKHTLSKSEMEDYPDWDLEGCDLKDFEDYTVYERFALSKGKWLNEVNGSDYEDDEMIFTVSFILEDKEDKVLFIEEMQPDDFPFGEAHWEKVHNRWLGYGEAENQFENQIAKNLSANLRRRALLWATKKIFQSTDPDKSDLSLIKEVSDGTVLEVGREGAISQVNMQTQHLGDFQSFDMMIDENSQQKSFTFEAASGETMPSGTPFRLGVVLSNTVNTHFNLKKEVFGDMLIDLFNEHILEIFKDMSKSERIRYASDEEGVEELMESVAESRADKAMIDALLNTPIDKLLGMSFDKEEVKQKFLNKVKKEKYFFVNITDDYYDDLKYSMTLETTGQYANVEKEVETLTTILQMSMTNPQSLNDPRIMKLIELITAKTGQSVKGLLGEVSKQDPAIGGLMNDAMTQQTLATNLAPNESGNMGQTQTI